MRCRLCLILAFMAIILSLPASAEMREWTDSQGRKIQAEYVSVEAGKVNMKLANGKLAAVPFAQLSEADQAWVKHRFENPPAPKPEPPKPAPKSTPPPSPRPAPKTKEIDWAPLKEGGMNVPNFDPLPEPDPNTLIPVNDWIGGRYFFMKPDGSDAFPHLKIENRIKGFSDGLAYVKTDDHKGYINREGKWVLGGDGGKPLPEGGEYFQAFSEGRALFRVQSRMAYIDTEGKVVGKTGVYFHAKDFSEGLALVYDGDTHLKKAWHYIDRDGNVALKGPWHMANSFSSGVAWVALDEQKMIDRLDGRKRLINTKGESVFGDAVFPGTVTYRFVGGYGSSSGRVYRADGSVYMEEHPQYFLTSFSDDGTVAIAQTKATYGYFGRLVHLPTKTVYGPKIPLSHSRNFQEGIAPLHLSNHDGPNKWMGLDRSGRFISKEGFLDEPYFKDGFAVCRRKFGPDNKDIRVVVINRKGEIIWKGEPRK